MKIKLLLVLFCLHVSQIIFSQDILEQYIQTGFENNQSIKQQEFALERSVYALKEAKSLFLPNVSFLTDYFLADGGRLIDLPLGDLLNPIYTSLNELTNSSNFPQIENQSILFNPDNYYDARFRTTLPVLNIELQYNRRIKQEQVSLQQVEIDLYKRELAKEIKVAYFSYLKTLKAISIYEIALKLANESKRINEALFRNDKVNRTSVLRSENEIAKYAALKENAQRTSNSAKSYFNFLLNKDLTDEILVDSSYSKVASYSGNSATIKNREELVKLQISSNINNYVEGLSKSYIVPKLNTFFDIGLQNYDWQFDNNSGYYFFGVSLRWDLFSSGKNQYKIKQVQIENQIIQSQYDYVDSQLLVQFNTAVNSFNSSLESYKAAILIFKTSQKYYSDMLKLYQEGLSLFIELLDAQNQLVRSELEVNISLYDTYIRAAEIEYANASFNINNY